MHRCTISRYVIALCLFGGFTAAPAYAQNDGAQLPSEAACNAVRERVQLALGQADRALQSENNQDVELWSGIASNYAEVFSSFCAGVAPE